MCSTLTARFSSQNPKRKSTNVLHSLGHERQELAAAESDSSLGFSVWITNFVQPVYLCVLQAIASARMGVSVWAAQEPANALQVSLEISVSSVSSEGFEYRQKDEKKLDKRCNVSSTVVFPLAMTPVCQKSLRYCAAADPVLTGVRVWSTAGPSCARVRLEQTSIFRTSTQMVGAWGLNWALRFLPKLFWILLNRFCGSFKVIYDPQVVQWESINRELCICLFLKYDTITLYHACEGFELYVASVEHSQIWVCVFQYSPSRSVTLLPVWMGGTAMNGTGATPASADMDTGGSTAKKVDQHCCYFRPNLQDTCQFS